MKTFLLVPDSFKGTLSSGEICAIMRERILAHEADARVISIPVADGGEGSVDCFLSAMEGQRVTCRAVNPFLRKWTAFTAL